MEAPRHYSVSPLYSFVTVPSHRELSFSAALGRIVRWLTGRQPKPTQRELQLEAAIIERLAAEMADETSLGGGETRQDGDHQGMPPIAPKLQPKRPRRLTGREDR